MDKIEYIKLENEDGSYSEPIALSTNSDHIDINGKTLTEVIGNIDFEEDGSIAEQIVKLKNKDISIDEKLDTTVYINDIINNLNSEEEKKPLSAKQGKELKNKINFYKNVKNYGASGNGIDNDTQAIQSLLNQGGSIYFPDGTYLISSPLNIDNKIKSIVLSEGAIITTNSLIDSIISINNTSTNLVIEGGTIDCNSKAERGIYVKTIVYSPTFKDIMIKDATECGLQIKNKKTVGGSCHGFLTRVKVYNKNTLATCIGLYVHDMHITDCECFYTNCGIYIGADMQMITGVHIWAGGPYNTNHDTFGIKYEPSSNANQIILTKMYFDGMNVGVYSTKGQINMDNILFFNPSEGTYLNPVCLLSENTYNTQWKLGHYYKYSVVPTGLMDYVNFDSNNIEIHDTLISEYYENSMSPFQNGYIDFGCNYNCLTKDFINISDAYVTKIFTNKYYLFGYYVLRPTSTKRRFNIDLKITNKQHYINHIVNIVFNYDSNGNITIEDEKVTAVNKSYRNPTFGITLGSILQKTSVFGNKVDVLPIYLIYDGEGTGYTSGNDFIVENLTKESPDCLMLFKMIEQNESINGIRTLRLADTYDAILRPEQKTNVFICEKSVYKVYIYSYGYEHLYNNFVEYTIARYNNSVSIIQTNINGNITIPTLTFDINTEMLTIAAPNGQWYYIKAVHN